MSTILVALTALYLGFDRVAHRGDVFSVDDETAAGLVANGVAKQITSPTENNMSNTNLELATPKLAPLPKTMEGVNPSITGRDTLSEHEHACTAIYEDEHRPLGVGRAATAIDLRRRFPRLDDAGARRVADVLHARREARAKTSTASTESMSLTDHRPPPPHVTGVPELDTIIANGEEVPDTAERLAREQKIPFVDAAEQAVRQHKLAVAMLDPDGTVQSMLDPDGTVQSTEHEEPTE